MNDNALKIELIFFSGRITHTLHILIYKLIWSYNMTSRFVVSVENMSENR